MVEKAYLRTPSLTGDNIEAKRQEIADYFNATFDHYDSLFETLRSDEAYYQQPIPLRHPLIFYYGHTATFFINKLLLSGLINERVNPQFESMFAIGVDEMGWDDLNPIHYEWPTIVEVKTYRQQVKQLINRLISDAPLILPIEWNHPWWTIMMGIEHEQIHIETSSVLIRQQALDLVQNHPEWQPWTKTATAPQNKLISIPAGKVDIAKADDGYYGWDNEYGSHQAEISEFKASQFLVSNHEFLAFVESGDYQKDEYWQEEGQKWREFAASTAPNFWIESSAGWQLRLMTEVIEMPWDWPVETNYHEAKAFCNWKAKQTGLAIRLPTEDEWNRLYGYASITELENGQQAVANLHHDYGASPCPVNEFAQGDCYDVVGNVWQWTETAIYPFEGFKVHAYYDDFTMPTFDGRHNLFRVMTS